jgi:hypothetical protein
MTTEERLRSAIHKYTETIEPARDGWDRIRDRTAARHRRPRWQPAMAAAAAAVVLAIVVAAVAVVRSDDGDGTSVQTPPAGSTSAPSEIVAATDDDRVVVLDTATGAELRSLADGADAQTTIAVTPDGARVFFDRPSSPASDPPRELATVPTSGGEAQRLIGGAGQPAVSPDGRLLAFVTYSPRTDQGQPNRLSVVELPESFEGWIPNVVGDGTVGETDQQISGVSWAPDSRHLVYTLLRSPQGSYPRVAESASGIQLDQAPIVPINDGSAVAGYLGDTGQMLGRTCLASNEGDQRLRVIVIDPQSGQETKHLFRYPELCGSERLSSDPSGRHVLALGAAGLYRWSEGDAEPTKIADGIRAAAWVPGVPTCRDGDDLPCDPGDENLQLTDKVVVAEGERNGVAWQLLAYDSQAGLCVGLRAGPGEGAGCGSGVPPLPISVGWGQQAGFGAIAQGIVRKDVSLVRLELSNGATIETTPVGADAGFEANFFVASLPEDIDLVRGIAIAADGRELGRQETPRVPERRDTLGPATDNADPTRNQ